MQKLVAALALIGALGFAGSAIAAPVQLSDNQLDIVTAGRSHASVSVGGHASGGTASVLLTVGFADAHRDSAVAGGAVLAVGIGRNSSASGGLSVSASSR